MRARMFCSSRVSTSGPDSCPKRYAKKAAATYFRGVFAGRAGKMKMSAKEEMNTMSAAHPSLLRLSANALKSRGLSALTAAIPTPTAVCANVFAMKYLQVVAITI